MIQCFLFTALFSVPMLSFAQPAPNCSTLISDYNNAVDSCRDYTQHCQEGQVAYCGTACRNACTGAYNACVALKAGNCPGYEEFNQNFDCNFWIHYKGYCTAPH